VSRSIGTKRSLAPPASPAIPKFPPHHKAFEDGGRSYFTHAQYKQVAEAFSIARKKRQPTEVQDFITQAAIHCSKSHWTRRGQSQGAIAEGLSELNKTTTKLIDAIALLKNLDTWEHLDGYGDRMLLYASGIAKIPGFEPLVIAGDREYLEGLSQFLRAAPVPLAGANLRHVMRSLWTNLVVLHFATTFSMDKCRPNRGTRAKDIKSLELLGWLSTSWYRQFGKRPSHSRESEFHRVSRAIGSVIGLNIGHSVLMASEREFRRFQAEFDSLHLKK
jgi:hypothetical protein